MAARHAAFAPRGVCHHERTSLPQPPTAIITDCNTHGDGAAMALAQLGRLSGDNAVSLVVYDGLPQDSIVDIDVASVIQSTRQGVGKQIADMVRQLINGDDIDSFRCSGSRNSPQARRPKYTKFQTRSQNPKRFGFIRNVSDQHSGHPDDRRCLMQDSFYDSKARR
jgi:hypothetical protein